MLDMRQRILTKLTLGVAQSCYWLELASSEVEDEFGAGNANSIRRSRGQLLEHLIQELLMAGVPARIVRQRLHACRSTLAADTDPRVALAAALSAEAFVTKRCRVLPTSEPCRSEILLTLITVPLQPKAA
ncbi:MAG: hypothetical protein AAFY56_05900 [Pseudomonadota bacterium]